MRKVLRIWPRTLGMLLPAMLLLTAGSAGAATGPMNPIAISFSSPRVGYVLSLSDCAANTCAELRSTSNGGDSWSVVSVPAQLTAGLKLALWSTYGTNFPTLNLHFADARDGWIYGTVPAPATSNTSNPNWQSRLWATHDGARTWHQVRLGSLGLSDGVFQMATHGGWTYLFGGSYQTGSARVLGTGSTTDHWANKSAVTMLMPAGGTQLEGSFTFAGSKGWFVSGNDRGFNPSLQLSSDGSWRTWKTPLPAKLGASYAPVVAVTSKILVTVCTYAGSVTFPASAAPAGWNKLASWLFISYDAGATFKPFRRLTSSVQDGYYAVPGLPATPALGTILLDQYTNYGNRLVRSSDWGRSWRIVISHNVLQVEFVSRISAFAIADQSTGQTSQLNTALLRTNDAGSDWSVVHL
jgi:hypothetical protein